MSALANRPALKTTAAAVLILAGSVSGQVSAAISSFMFDRIGTFGVSGLRFLIAATFLLVIIRPTLRGRSLRAWIYILMYGIALAALNALFYSALGLVSLGVAVTIQILGPIVVAMVGTRLGWASIFPVIGFIGVVLICNPSGDVNWAGLLLAAGSALAYGGYVLFAQRVGEESVGLQGLTLAVAIAAVILAPFSVEALPRVQPMDWALLAISATVGLGLGLSFDLYAVRFASARVIAPLFLLDPVVAAVVGAIVLGQILTLSIDIGIVLVVISGAAVVWRSGKAGDKPSEMRYELPPPKE